MSASLKDILRRFKIPDRTGRIDHVYGTFNQTDLEHQFRSWNWTDRRQSGISVVTIFATVALSFAAGDVLVHGLTRGSVASGLACGAVVLVSGLWIWLTARQKPSAMIDLMTLGLSACIGASLTIEFLVRGIAWHYLALPSLMALVLSTLFIRQPLKSTIAGMAAQLVPFLAALLFKGGGMADYAHAGLLLVGGGMSLYYMRKIAIVSREHFLQNSQLEQLATELDKNMKTMALEHQTVQRAAEENAALADELALSRMEAEEAAYYLENILENIAQGVVVLDRDKRITKFNSTYVKLAGIPSHLAKSGTHLSEIIKNAIDRGLYVDEDTFKAAKAAIDTPGGLNLKGPSVIERAQGNGRYVEVRRNPLPDGGEVSTYTDITERRRALEIMRAQALSDPLTDLSNRHHYAARLDEAIARSKRTDAHVALAFLDLDLFKPVNDTYGHAVGDAVLREVAHILRAHVREVDTVARLGGDEFAIIFDGIKAIRDVRNPIKRILNALSKPLTIDGVSISIGMSIGVAFAPLDAESAEGLASVADHALYEAKQHGRGCWKLSRPEYEGGLPDAGGNVERASIH
jgi:diguanylate cyclase (GGDEF)-like protein